jgi:type II secretory pathway component PulF
MRLIADRTLVLHLEIRPDVFTKLELEMIRIGEWFGFLDVTIRELQNIVRMIEETDSETVKRQNFWKVLHFFIS